MRPHDPEDAAKTVQRLNHARDEPGVGAIAREDCADGDFEAADQRFGFLTFVVGHIHSPRRARIEPLQVNVARRTPA